jgi:hypothetical protein
MENERCFYFAFFAATGEMGLKINEEKTKYLTFWHPSFTFKF